MAKEKKPTHQKREKFLEDQLTGSESIDKPLSYDVTIRFVCAMRHIMITDRTIKNRAGFALRIGINSQNISAIEREDRNVTLEAAVKLCKDFHISTDWLFLGQGDMYGNAGSGEKISQLFSEIEDLKDRVAKLEKAK